MFSLDIWQEIFYTIRKNKLRTFLTAFSVSWGIFMLIILQGAGSGLNNGVKYQFRDDAVNSIRVYPGQTSLAYDGMQPGRYIQFTNEDYEAISQQVGDIEYLSSRFYLSGEFTVRYQDNYSSFSVRGVHPEYKYIEKTHLTEGRYINDKDVTERRKVAVIGTKVVESLFKSKVQPLGKSIDINGIIYSVVGVFEDEGSENETRAIYIPISTAQIAYGVGNKVNGFGITVGDATPEESRLVEAQLMDLFSSRHHFDPDDPRAIRMWNSLTTFQRFQNLMLGIKLFLWVIGAFTIVAGIVGVSNIMLITVKERTKEIGVRKALGATPASIIKMFLLEAIFITIVAGYAGLFLGVLSVEALGWAMNNFSANSEFFRSPEIDWTTALYAFAILVIAGALAGYFPSRRAAKVQPIVALRDE